MNLYTLNVDTSTRKPLVKALVELLAQPPVYSGPPFYSYKVGDYVVDRQGNVIVPDETSDETIQWLKEKLEDKGFTFDDNIEVPIINEASEDTHEPETTPDDSDEETEDEDTAEETTEGNAPAAEPETEEDSNEESDEDDTDSEEADSDDEVESETEVLEMDNTAEEESPADAPEKPEAPDDGKTHITLSLPRFQFTPDAITRLKAIVQSKQTLLKKALDTDVLVIQLTEDKVLFPWFTDHGLTGEMDAYAKLVFAISKLAVNQKRASSEEKINDNEKLAMRLFLIRLGFIGDEFKTARAILTRNFTGNSAWKVGPNGTDVHSGLSIPEVFHPTAAQPAAPDQEEHADE